MRKALTAQKPYALRFTFCPTLDQSSLISDLQCLVPTVDPQLAIGGTEVVAHRAGRDVERLGDLGVAQAALGQAQDLDLALRKRLLASLGAGGLCQRLVGLRAEVHLPIGQVADDSGDFGDVVIILENVAIDAGLEQARCRR